MAVQPCKARVVHGEVKIEGVRSRNGRLQQTLVSIDLCHAGQRGRRNPIPLLLGRAIGAFMVLGVSPQAI